ncbi:MAG TPA: DUF1844 domain-containing protein [Blastocatellia bacterium]|nr:DUF1844 domain-containing protein [Blastocatellia bacterium]
MVDEKEPSIKITDRRKFNLDGTPRETAEEPEAEQPSEPAPQAAEPAPAPGEEAKSENVLSFPGEADRKRPDAQADAPPSPEDPRAAAMAEMTSPNPMSGAAEKAYNAARQKEPSSIPDASFLSLLNMLGVQAAMHLGLIQGPEGGSEAVDLEAARHMIDMLGIVEEKTRGNLTKEEEALLENILADLRMQFVSLSRRR